MEGSIESLLQRTRELAQDRLAPRADTYDRSSLFPTEDFADLAELGLLGAAVPVEHGGLGLGPLHGQTGALWEITATLAEVDLSLARCWEGHQNAMVMIDGMASQAQRERWFRDVIGQGKIWVGWSGEPQRRKPGEGRIGTELRRVDGGWRVRGSKVFATSAGGAHQAILFVNTEGPGGARHAEGDPSSLLMLACSLQDPSVSVDGSWWDAHGMRGTVSHLVRFDDTFVPDEDVIGAPGQYLTEQWQTFFVPHYAASFYGALRGVLSYTRAYVASQRREGDPYVQQRVGRMQASVETLQLWMDHVSRLYDAGRSPEARLAGSKVRYMAERLGAELLEDAIHVCGARALVRPSAFERTLRDLTFYFRHDNLDHLLATLGRAALGESFDPAFHKP